MSRWALVVLAPADLMLVGLLAAGVPVPAWVRVAALLLLAAVVLVEVSRWGRHYRRAGHGRRVAATHAGVAVLPRAVSAAMRWELGVWTGLVRGVRRRPDVPAGAVAFTHHRAMQAARWTFVGVLVTEVGVVHLLVPAGTVRWALLLLGSYSLIWVTAYVLGAGPVRPHLVTDRAIVLRCGLTGEVVVPLAALADAWPVRRSRERTATRQLDGQTLHLVDNGGTSLDLELTSPVRVTLGRGRTAQVDAVRVWVDDAAAMARRVRTAAGIDTDRIGPAPSVGRTGPAPSADRS